MDPLAKFTALSPPAGPVGSEETTSQQCSADPSAFLLGHHQPPHRVVVDQGRSARNSANRSASASTPPVELRLALDVPAGISVSQLSQPASQFQELFESDTQHEMGATEATSGTSAAGSPRKANATEKKDSAGASFLSRLESRWREQMAPASAGTDEAHSANLSEDLVANGMRKGGDQEVEEPMLESDNATRRFAELPTPPRQLTDYDADSNDETRAAMKDGGDDDDDDDSTEMSVGHDNTEANIVVADADAMEESTEVLVDRRESMDSYPDTQSLGDENEAEDPTDATPLGPVVSAKEDATSLQLTPPPDQRPDKDSTPGGTKRFLKRKQKARESLPNQNPQAFADSEEMTLIQVAAQVNNSRRDASSHSATQSKHAPSQFLKHQRLGSPQDVKQQAGDSDEDSLPPTQPTKPPLPGPPSRVALKKRGKSVMAQPVAQETKPYEFVDSQCRCGETTCVCSGMTAPLTAKSSPAIRNLEFSFAIPESQDSESQLLDSVPDVGVIASKALKAFDHNDVKIIETTTPSGGGATARTPNTSAKLLPSASVSTTPTKKRKVTSGETPQKGSPQSRTPSKRKRNRAFLSPDAGVPVPQTPDTPCKTRGTTSSVRTRAKILSPVPSSRTYLSRSKTIFKYKHEFCLTGFVKDAGEANLVQLIEDHGGKVVDQDSVHKNNAKIVVIATPVSWRKKKFMFALASGIPVVHPEWIHACVCAGQILPFDGYTVPSGYSIVTGKFECLPVKPLEIFRGLRFGIPLDVERTSVKVAKDMGSVITFILSNCGAADVLEDLQPSREKIVDVVLADEYTKVCESFERHHKTPVKTFAWVTECVVLQRLVNLTTEGFEPQKSRELSKSGTVLCALSEIGDKDRSTLKLHVGELVLVDLSDEGKIDHFLLFDVCEIINIRVETAPVVQGKKKEEASLVTLHVGVLERFPNSPQLSRTHIRTIDLSPHKVKRRVVAVSKTDFDSMLYRDESIFYYDDVENDEGRAEKF